jgi:polysaccharide biosynthesis protein PslH
MKKILYISQVFPYPDDGGGKIKTLNSLTALAKKYEVYAIFISEKKPTKKDLNYLKKIGVKKIKVFFSAQILDSVKDDYHNLIKNFAKLNPHYVFQYTYKPAFSFIKKAIKTYKPNIIHIDHINISQYLPKNKNEVWILEHHNLEFYLLWTRFIHSNKWSRKLYLLIEATLTYLFERKNIKKFDHVFAISDPESKRIKKFFKIKNVTAQPLVYPVFRFKKNKNKNKKILFIGGLGWPPNEDAIEWFIKKMFPKIIKHIPKIELHIVGKNNPVLTKRLPKHKQIIFHDYQKNLRSFIKEATCFILPFRMGGGVRIKSLTALSAGIPIVSTPLGVEGLNLQKNKHYLEANSETEFAEQVIKLIEKKILQKKISIKQVEYLKTYHSKKENNKWLQNYELAVISAIDCLT